MDFITSCGFLFICLHCSKFDIISENNFMHYLVSYRNLKETFEAVLTYIALF